MFVKLLLFLPTQVVPFPVYPWLHLQLTFPGIFIQVEAGSQMAHTSKSDGINYTVIQFYRDLHISFLPKQSTPFPVYPWLHVQLKPPTVFVHVALELQLLSPLMAHSLMSAHKKSKI